MKEFKSLAFPVAIVLIGIITLVAAIRTEQNGFVIFGVFALILTGLTGVVMTLKNVTKTLSIGISVALAVLCAGLVYADFVSIQAPIAFNKEKEKRYEHVKQRLIDIRTAQLAYKRKYQKYAENFNVLVSFVQTDSLEVIKATGNAPDTMSLEDAIKAKLVFRDTSKIAVNDSLFKTTEEGRAHPFDIKMLSVIPFTDGAKFKLEAGFVERSSVKVPVFQATDTQPFDVNHVLQVGSISDPKTNGNWE